MAKSKAKIAKANKSPSKRKVTTKKKKTLAEQSTVSQASGFEPFQSLRRQVDDLFTKFTASWPHFEIPKIEWPVLAGSETEHAIAKFDLSENDKAVKIVADVPGVTEKDIDVVIKDGFLTIKGEKKSERKEEGENFYVSERNFGSFSRAFRIPDGIDQNSVAADFDNGVLTVTMPKLSKAKSDSRSISVQKK